jgi:hypothetical protein
MWSAEGGGVHLLHAGVSRTFESHQCQDFGHAAPPLLIGRPIRDFRSPASLRTSYRCCSQASPSSTHYPFTLFREVARVPCSLQNRTPRCTYGRLHPRIPPPTLPTFTATMSESTSDSFIEPPTSPSTDEIDSLPSSATSSTVDEDEYLSDADREWRESLQQMELLLTMVLVPYMGKYFGRKCAYWGTSL